MTNKEIIETLKVALAKVEWNYPMDYSIAIEEAIKAVEFREKLELNKKVQHAKCDCYRTEYGKNVCYGTKEREVCSCGGNKSECDFYCMD